ncbi:leucine-rich repeat domain-containing protein [Porphyromonas sp.]|uniref:leucine-rich repeat domain-containing protein n=1 Tax=Porphyromonas sp. TaxID=1924944 RepID=UPI003AB13308
MHYIYKLSRIAITALLLTYTPILFGQTITMKSIQAEGEISLSLATHSDNSTVTIDWGDGNKKDYTLGKVETECKGPATKQTITITGDIAKLNCMASKLIELDVTKCPNLWVLQAAYNNIGALDLSASKALGNLEVFGNMIKELDVSACTELERLVCSGNYLSNLNVSSCKKLKYFDCTRMARITSLDLTQNQNLTNLLINECSISELKLPQGNVPLEEFWCHKNKISSLDLSSYTGLKELNCSDNPLTSLTVNAPEMNQLMVMNTQLKDVAFLSSMPKLTYLMLTGNAGLTSVSLSKNSQLTDLGLSKCSLSKLDLSAQKVLKNLWAEGNQLTAVDLSSCEKLESVKLKGNQISQITFPAKSSITTLALPENALVDISLKGLNELQSLDLGKNQLTKIDLSSCPKLKVLNLGSNQIHTLDLQHTPQLKMLGVVGNGMSAEQLDKIYEALPELDEPSAKVNLYNGTKKDSEALSSTTDIAVERNWKPFVLGDGSWRGVLDIEPLQLRIAQQKERVTLYPSASGHPLRVSLYSSDGMLHQSEQIVDDPMIIYLPAPGSYVLLIEDCVTSETQTQLLLN